MTPRVHGSRSTILVVACYALAAGTAIEGPALVEERESTCVSGPGETARVDDAGNLIAELETA